MARFQYDTFDVARWSQPVQIPKNSIARLMYYLDVVCTLVAYDEHNLDRLRNFKNYQSITDTELRLLYATCVMLKPSLLIGKVMFEDEDGDLCGNSVNRIYEISQVRHNLLAVNSIFIAGRNRRVNKVMAYKPEWLRDYYILPIATLTTIFEEERRQEALNDLIDGCRIS